MDVQEFRQHASEVTRGFSAEFVKDLVLRCLAEDMG
jgi:hypothetical protein